MKGEGGFAQAVLTWVRSNAKELGIDEDFFANPSGRVGSPPFLKCLRNREAFPFVFSARDIRAVRLTLPLYASYMRRSVSANGRGGAISTSDLNFVGLPTSRGTSFSRINSGLILTSIL